jgi:hypothetical protein
MSIIIRMQKDGGAHRRTKIKRLKERIGMGTFIVHVAEKIIIDWKIAGTTDFAMLAIKRDTQIRNVVSEVKEIGKLLVLVGKMQLIS